MEQQLQIHISASLKKIMIKQMALMKNLEYASVVNIIIIFEIIKACIHAVFRLYSSIHYA